MNKYYYFTTKQKIYIFIKRVLDIIICLPICIIILPIMIIISICIKIDSKGNILFKQKRVGKNKKTFLIWKFRTMRTDTPKDVPTHLLSDPNTHITKVGKFLRKTSLDELPQVYQALFGVISIVGPRPALWNQDDLILERDKYHANDIKPGITGLAQISGRDELSIEKKALLDGEYVKNFGFIMDMKCFINTFFKVIKGEGVVEGAKG
ncbi:MAG: sugar transferase [Eubacteriales bacterium]|nr:sugar transferase [Eubacteriales bacterium]